MQKKIDSKQGFLKEYFSFVWKFVSLPLGYIVSFLMDVLPNPFSKKRWNKFLSSSGRIVAQEWGDSILIAFLLAVFIRTFFIQAFKIPSGSMIPTLLIGDRLMVTKLRYGPKVPFTVKRLPGFSKLQRGDVIVFKYPVNPKKDFIKRLIAFEGESIEIKRGDIYIDGKMVTDPIIKNTFYYNTGRFGQEGQIITVPENKVFVLGDNSASSSDGRVWGFVPEINIVGRAEIIYWPFRRMRWLNSK